MQNVIFTCAVFMLVVVSLGYSYPLLVQNEDGDYFLLEQPAIRQKRQTTVDVTKSSAGATATLGHTGTIFKNDNHEVLGNGFVSKSFPGPATVGGGIGYQHIPSGSNVNIHADRTPKFGVTNVGVDGAANIWRNKNTRLDATGGWSRSYTPYGAGRPDYNVGLQFTHRF